MPGPPKRTIAATVVAGGSMSSCRMQPGAESATVSLPVLHFAPPTCLPVLKVTPIVSLPVSKVATTVCLPVVDVAPSVCSPVVDVASPVCSPVVNVAPPVCLPMLNCDGPSQQRRGITTEARTEKEGKGKNKNLKTALREWKTNLLFAVVRM